MTHLLKEMQFECGDGELTILTYLPGLLMLEPFYKMYHDPSGITFKFYDSDAVEIFIKFVNYIQIREGMGIIEEDIQQLYDTYVRSMLNKSQGHVLNESIYMNKPVGVFVQLLDLLEFSLTYNGVELLFTDDLPQDVRYRLFEAYTGISYDCPSHRLYCITFEYAKKALEEIDYLKNLINQEDYEKEHVNKDSGYIVVQDNVVGRSKTYLNRDVLKYYEVSYIYGYNVTTGKFTKYGSNCKSLPYDTTHICYVYIDRW